MSTSRRAAWAAAIAFGGIALTWLVTIAVLFAVEDARHQRAATGIREYNTGWWVVVPLTLTGAFLVAGVVLAFPDSKGPAPERTGT